MLRQRPAELRQSNQLVSHEQRSYAWMLTDSGVESGYLIGWHAHFHGYGHLRRICGEAWRICRFRGSVWAFWLSHLKKFCSVIGLYFRRIRSVGYSSTRHSVFMSVYYFERLACTSNIWKHFRQCSVICDCGKRFEISTTFVYGAWEEYRCFTDEFCWRATERRSERHQQHKQKPR
jgi:hypothetical protein